MSFSTVRVNLSLWVPGQHPDTSAHVHTSPTEHRLGLSSPCAGCTQAVHGEMLISTSLGSGSAQPQENL